jgi:hypothetical protein
MPLSSRGVKRVKGILQKMDEFGFTTAGRKLQRLFSRFEFVGSHFTKTWEYESVKENVFSTFFSLFRN